MEKILSEQKKKLTPSPNLKSEVDEFVKELKSKGLDVMLGGSVAMGTNLSDKHEADIFVRLKGPDYSNQLEAFLKKNKYSYKKLHGSRDYFQIQKKGLYELIPVKNIKKPEEAETIVDMSPFHVDYFNKKLDEDMKQEIRLAKAFCKAQKIYGAESHIKGFSGHSLNLLIQYYASFKNLLIQSQKWKPKLIIDVENQIKDPLMELDKSKTDGPLIIIDPVYKYRNASAALSLENFNKFKKKAGEFIKNPSFDYFKKYNLKDNLDDDYIILEVKPLKDKDDVAGSKIIKIKEFLERELKNNGFEIKDSLWEYEDPSIIALKTKFLGKTAIINGPPTHMKSHVEDFKRKHDGVYQEKGFLKAKTVRDFEKAEDLLNILLKNEYVNTRCNSIKIINR